MSRTQIETPSLIDVDELSARLQEPGLIVLDATVELPPAGREGIDPARSGAAIFAEGHIPGAQHADLLDALSRRGAPFRFARPGSAQLVLELARLGVTRDSEVVLYDDDRTYWASRLWWQILDLGHASTRVLDGGLSSWRDNGQPLEVGPPQTIDAIPPDRRVRSRPQSPRFVDRSDVEAVLAGARSAELICALDPDVFEGSAPGRYTRSGHIPGSSNVPARRLLDSSGRLLETEALRAVFASVLDDPRPIILYCGGGISAALDALALHVLDRHDISIYDGSLEEWSADPSLPLELGR